MPGDTPHQATVSADFWRVGDVIYGRQLGGPSGGTLQGAIEAMGALEDLVGEDERLPMLFDAKTVGWMDADARA